MSAEGTAKPDMLVVVANHVRFRRNVIEERSWYPIRLESSRIEALKWLTIYKTCPERAITHIARIIGIQPFQETGKFQVNFGELIELDSTVKLDPGWVAGFGGHRYSWRQRLSGARIISDLKPWG